MFTSNLKKPTPNSSQEGNLKTSNQQLATSN